MNAVDIAIKEGRLSFHNGRYKYTPTSSTQKRIEELKKPFDSIRANKFHEVKLINRKKLWQETDKRLAKIEKYVDKGLVRITNKEFICS